MVDLLRMAVHSMCPTGFQHRTMLLEPSTWSSQLNPH